jgi:hypothetical protein
VFCTPPEEILCKLKRVLTAPDPISGLGVGHDDLLVEGPGADVVELLRERLEPAAEPRG